MKSMRDLGEHFFAIYHSHPTAPALPSAEDINLTSYPDALHLIISLNTKGILEMRGFKIQENTSLEMPLTMNDD
jgi:proteasome lid subunit RPN8/RPN11